MTIKSSELINRQVLTWEKQWRLAQENARSSRQQLPMISISSAYGSQGLSLGRIVSEILGIPIYDRDLIEEIATSAKVRERTVDALDERVKDLITEYIASQFEREFFTTSDFLRHLSGAVLAISRKESAIIIGRGSQFILYPKQTLRIRTTAPLDVRINAVAQLNKLSQAEARAAVLRKDAARAAFCKLHFNRDVTDPNDYDLVINTMKGTIEQFSELITYLFLLRFGSKAKKTR